MMNPHVVQIIERYYQAFNQQDMGTFFSLLTEEVVHEINQGKVETGKKAFMQFMDHMNRCYREKVVDLVIFSSSDPSRAAAEFYIEGTYLSTDSGLPEAKGQKYRLRVGAFFSLQKEKISRVTNYYNLNEWLSQIK